MRKQSGWRQVDIVWFVSKVKSGTKGDNEGRTSVGGLLLNTKTVHFWHSVSWRVDLLALVIKPGEKNQLGRLQCRKRAAVVAEEACLGRSEKPALIGRRSVTSLALKGYKELRPNAHLWISVHQTSRDLLQTAVGRECERRDDLKENSRTRLSVDSEAASPVVGECSSLPMVYLIQTFKLSCTKISVTPQVWPLRTISNNSCFNVDCSFKCED